MKLYRFRYSPFARKVQTVLDLLGLRYDAIDVRYSDRDELATLTDGRYIVATVSSANRVVVIDAQQRRIVKAFENVGKYPWSVTIPGGQNYCH